MVIVNPLTSQILKSHLDGSFNDYFDWRKREGEVGERLMEIRAIEFPYEESYFLAGPIMFQGKAYGMAYFQHKKDAEPIAVLEQKQIDSMKRITDLTWAPYPIKVQFAKYLDPHCTVPHSPATEHFFDPETKQSFSALDLRFGGAEELDHKMIARAKKYSRAKAKAEGKTAMLCTAFWKTKIAEKRIREYMGKEVVGTILEEQAKLAHQWNEEERNVIFCKERPYQIYLLGTDDASYTKTFESEELMYKFADRMKQLGGQFVTNTMTFTN